MSPEREQLVDPEALREQVRLKYRAVAADPEQEYHFHTGRPLAQRLGYDSAVVEDLPDQAVESFAGVGNPFSARRLERGERVLDVGSGAGFDAFIAAAFVGAAGAVIGVDMTTEMLEKAQATAVALGLTNVEFRHGLIEELPIEDGWADVVISNGVLNLCADKRSVIREQSAREASGPPDSGPVADLAGVARRRCAAVRRHRQRPPDPDRNRARHRPVDGLNRGRAAPCGLADPSRRRRFRRRGHRAAHRHLRRSSRRGQRAHL